jgi:hypothetical protein
MEFHIAKAIRERLDLDDLLFSFDGNVVFANVAASRKLAQRLERSLADEGEANPAVNAGALFAMGLIDELSHAMVARYRREIDPAVLSEALGWFAQKVTAPEVDRLLLQFTSEFPNVAIFRGQTTAAEWLKGSTEVVAGAEAELMPNREAAFEELLLLWLANSNPAFAPFKVLFDDVQLKQATAYAGVTTALPEFFVTRPPVAPGLGSLLDALRAPMLASPDSLTGQLDFILETWSPYLGDDLKRALLAIDVLREEEVAIWMRFHPPAPDWYRHGAPGGGEGFVGDEFVGFEEDFVVGADGVRRRRYPVDYQAPLQEYEAFSADQAWMPTVVLMAKSTYVWLEQLSKKYKRHIQRLDQIPNEELQLLAKRGITGLWLIGLWERSRASRTIKRLRGNPDAVASAYSLKDYLIAEDLGGESAYQDLRDRAARAGLRLASDMVPNHMGIDSDWVIEHPEWFLSRWESPFPVYSFEGPDLSTDSRIEIKIEDHYYDQTDAAVVFRLRHYREGTTRFVYHGNDGTTFAWNDTAQLDYSKAEVREHVMQVILNVARRFPIIRFDAAMVLAKRHVQRLWFPLPGAGGSIPSRAENALSQEAFEALMPKEFWREVVDRVAAEVPGTLLLAEAFWLLEGYFVRTLGMHRVYNSAFMNMLRDEENAKYRSYLKKTIEFDSDILKRYVNFMSNPDERTAIDQFGSGDKYFGVSVLLATLPGLPMFGHGQIEGYTERYGMDFKQARLDETPDEGLMARHQELIAPLLKNRRLFAESTHFLMYDFWIDQGNGFGAVDENVFAYSNRYGDQRAVVLYNNRYESTHGTIHLSVGFLDKATWVFGQRSLADGLALAEDDGVVYAFRDTVVGLEYLRRASAFRNEGLTLDLRGYQHVVLLHWRELRSTAAEPWDRLCDELHGSGVPSMDDALLQMRQRPLREALRQALNLAEVKNFAEVAGELLAKTIQSPVIPESETGVLSPQSSRVGLTADEADFADTPALEAAADTDDTSTALDPLPLDPLPLDPPALDPPALDPRLSHFVEKAQAFAGKLIDIAHAEGSRALDAKPVSQSAATWPAEPAGERLAAAAVSLPSLTALIPAKLLHAGAAVLPLTDSSGSGGSKAVDLAWGPVLGWIVLECLPASTAKRKLFEDLQLRSALADAFSSIGLEGELAWRAAALVRVLLLEAETAGAGPAPPESFWHDPDVNWLAGGSSDFGTDYFNQERLEELICWLQLPRLLTSLVQDGSTGGAAKTAAATIGEWAGAAQVSGYKVRGFVERLAAGREATSAVNPAEQLEPAAKR